MKFDFIKFTMTVFLIFALCMGIYQLYNFLYVAIDTEYAVEIDCEETEKVTGYFVRNEFVISSGDSKYIDLTIDNGGKVAKSGTIANVYSTENAAKIQTEIRELQDSIDDLKNVISASSSNGNFASYTQEIRREALGILNELDNSSPMDAFERATDFITSVTKEKISKGEISDSSERLKALQSQMSALQNKSTSVTSYITSPESGYFTYKVDGAEEKISMDMTKDFSAEAFDEIVSACSDATDSSSAIGKVVKGSEWRVCFKSSKSKFEKVDVGDTLYIRIPSVTDSKIKCSVVEMFQKDDDVYIVLESNMVSGDLLSQRVCEVDIIIDSYNGLRIDKNAIRKVDGQDGVFVNVSGIINYKKVKILYIGSTFAVVEYDTVNENSLQAFDEVVIKGTNIYDGKVVI